MQLRSLTGTRGDPVVWPPGEPLHARCLHRDHAAPQAECTCGIYAHRTRDAALRRAASNRGAIFGEVELWGRLVEHERGYRAEYARPRGLWVPLAIDESARIGTVTGALSIRSSLSDYGLPTKLVHAGTGLALDLDDLRRVFVHEPVPRRPLRELLPSIMWTCLRMTLILSAILVAGITSAIAFALVEFVGLISPLVVGEVVYALFGGGVLAAIAGFSAGVAVVAGYYLTAMRFDLPGRL